MEQLDLTTPETTPSNSTYRVLSIMLDWGRANIHIVLLGQNGEIKTAAYNGATATALMVALNKADLSVKSLHRRILERLLADGVLAGTISGNPDLT